MEMEMEPQQLAIVLQRKHRWWSEGPPSFLPSCHPRPFLAEITKREREREREREEETSLV